jgi:nucleotide-binding universal stress UspA family protein
MRSHTGHANAARTDPSAIAADTFDFGALVVGHDGHHAATDDALRYAVQMAARLGAHVHVVHSVTVDDYGIDPDTAAFEADCARNLAVERQRIAAMFEGTTVRWTYHEERGDPADRLAQLAASVNAACIVVGSHPHGIARGLLGADSVPRWLLHHQPRPVLVVPAR